MHAHVTEKDPAGLDARSVCLLSYSPKNSLHYLTCDSLSVTETGNPQREKKPQVHTRCAPPQAEATFFVTACRHLAVRGSLQDQVCCLASGLFSARAPRGAPRSPLSGAGWSAPVLGRLLRLYQRSQKSEIRASRREALANMTLLGSNENPDGSRIRKEWEKNRI